jgi:hypothetical protein
MKTLPGHLYLLGFLICLAPKNKPVYLELVTFGLHNKPRLKTIHPTTLLPPTNPRYRTLEAIDVALLSGSKIIEQWGVADLFSLLKQLSAIPAPG